MEHSREMQFDEEEQCLGQLPWLKSPQAGLHQTLTPAASMQQQRLEKKQRHSLAKEGYIKQKEEEEVERNPWKETQQQVEGEDAKRQHNQLRSEKQKRNKDEQGEEGIDEDSDATAEFATGPDARWSWSTSSSIRDNAAITPLQQWNQQAEKVRLRQHEVEQDQGGTSSLQQGQYFGEKLDDLYEQREQRQHQQHQQQQQQTRQQFLLQQQQQARQQRVVQQQPMQESCREKGKGEEENNKDVDRSEIPENPQDMEEEKRRMKHYQQKEVEAHPQWGQDHVEKPNLPMKLQDEEEKQDHFARQESKARGGAGRRQTFSVGLDTEYILPSWYASSMPADNSSEGLRPPHRYEEICGVEKNCREGKLLKGEKSPLAGNEITDPAAAAGETTGAQEAGKAVSADAARIHATDDDVLVTEENRENLGESDRESMLHGTSSRYVKKTEKEKTRDDGIFTEPWHTESSMIMQHHEEEDDETKEKTGCVSEERMQQQEQKAGEHGGEKKKKEKRQQQNGQYYKGQVCADRISKENAEAVIANTCSASAADDVKSGEEDDAAFQLPEEPQGLEASEKKTERRTDSSKHPSYRLTNSTSSSIKMNSTRFASSCNHEKRIIKGPRDCAPLLQCLLSSEQQDSNTEEAKRVNNDSSTSSDESTCTTEVNSNSPCSSTGSSSLSNSPSSLLSSHLRASSDPERLILSSSKNNNGPGSSDSSVLQDSSNSSSSSEGRHHDCSQLSNFSSDGSGDANRNGSIFAESTVSSSSSTSKGAEEEEVEEEEEVVATEPVMTGLEFAFQQLLVPLPSLKSASVQLKARQSTALITATEEKEEKEEEKEEKWLLLQTADNHQHQEQKTKRLLKRKNTSQWHQQQQGDHEEEGKDDRETDDQPPLHPQQELHETCSSSSKSDKSASPYRGALPSKEEIATIRGGAAHTKAGIVEPEKKPAADKSRDGRRMRLQYTKDATRDNSRSSTYGNADDKCCSVGRFLHEEEEKEGEEVGMRDEEATTQQLSADTLKAREGKERKLSQDHLEKKEYGAVLWGKEHENSSDMENYSASSAANGAALGSRQDLDSQTCFSKPLTLAVAEAAAHAEEAREEEEEAAAQMERRRGIIETGAETDLARLFATQQQQRDISGDDEETETEEEEEEEERIKAKYKEDVREEFVRHQHKETERRFAASQQRQRKEEEESKRMGFSNVYEENDAELETLQRLLAEKLSRVLPEEEKLLPDASLSSSSEGGGGKHHVEEEEEQQHGHCSWERGNDREISDCKEAAAAATRGSNSNSNSNNSSNSSSTCADDDIDQQGGGLDMPLPPAAALPHMWQWQPGVGDDCKTSSTHSPVLRDIIAATVLSTGTCTPAAAEQHQQRRLEALSAFHLPPLYYDSKVGAHHSEGESSPCHVAATRRATATGEEEIAEIAATTEEEEEGLRVGREHLLEGADIDSEKPLLLKNQQGQCKSPSSPSSSVTATSSCGLWIRNRREDTEASAALERYNNASGSVGRLASAESAVVSAAAGLSHMPWTERTSLAAFLSTAAFAVENATRGPASTTTSNVQGVAATGGGGGGDEHPTQQQQQRNEGDTTSAAVAALLQILIVAMGSREGGEFLQLLRQLLEREQRQQGQQQVCEYGCSRGINSEQCRSSVADSNVRAALRLQREDGQLPHHAAGSSFTGAAVVDGGAAAAAEAEGRKASGVVETPRALRAEKTARGPIGGSMMRSAQDENYMDTKRIVGGKMGQDEREEGTAAEHALSLHEYVDRSSDATAEPVPGERKERTNGSSCFTVLDKNIEEQQDRSKRRVFQRRLSTDDVLLQQRIHMKQQQQQKRSQRFAGEQEEVTGGRQPQQQHQQQIHFPRQIEEGGGVHGLSTQQQQHFQHSQSLEQYNLIQHHHVLQQQQQHRRLQQQQQQQVRSGEQVQHWHQDRLNQEEFQRQQLLLQQILAGDSRIAGARTSSRQQPLSQREEEQLLLIQQWMKRHEQEGRTEKGDETHQEHTTCGGGGLFQMRTPHHASGAALLSRVDQRNSSRSCSLVTGYNMAENNPHGAAAVATGSVRNYEQKSGKSEERSFCSKETEENKGLASQKHLPHVITWERSNSSSNHNDKEMLLSSTTNNSSNILSREKRDLLTESSSSSSSGGKHLPSSFLFSQARASRQSGDTCNAEGVADGAAVELTTALHHAVHRGTAATAGETRSAVLQQQLQQQQKRNHQQETQQQEGDGKKTEGQEEGGGRGGGVEGEEEGQRRYYTRFHIGGRQQQEPVDQERWKSEGRIVGRSRSAEKSVGSVITGCYSTKRSVTNKVEAEEKETGQHLNKTYSNNKEDYSLRAAVSRFPTGTRPGMLHSSSSRSSSSSNIRPSSTRSTLGSVAAASSKEVVRGVYFDVTNQAWAANMRVKGRVQKKSFSLKRYGSEARQRAIQARKEMEKDFGKAPLLFFTGFPALPFAAALHSHNNSSNYNTTHMRPHVQSGGSMLQHHSGSSGSNRYITINHPHGSQNSSHGSHSNIVKSVSATANSSRYGVVVTGGRAGAPVTTAAGKNSTLQPGNSFGLSANTGESSKSLIVNRHGDTYMSSGAAHRGYFSRSSDPKKDATGLKEPNGSTR